MYHCFRCYVEASYIQVILHNQSWGINSITSNVLLIMMDALKKNHSSGNLLFRVRKRQKIVNDNNNNKSGYTVVGIFYHYTCTFFRDLLQSTNFSLNLFYSKIIDVIYIYPSVCLSHFLVNGIPHTC